MWNMIEDLNELCETGSRKLKEANEKIREAGGKLTGSDLEYLDKLMHMLKSIKTIEAMEDGGMSYNSYNSYDRGDSYRGMSRDPYYQDGYGSSRSRDSMGRFSRMSRDTGTINQLKSIMHNAPDDETRQEIQKFIEKMEHM